MKRIKPAKVRNMNKKSIEHWKEPTVIHTPNFQPFEMNRSNRYKTSPETEDGIRLTDPDTNFEFERDQGLSRMNDLNYQIQSNEEQKRNIIGTLKRIRYQTIERKYFKKDKSLNILTCRAKEQMKYLNRTDPETWTFESLANVFPVSSESIQKILYSRIRLHRDEDIERHDDDIRNNWLSVRDSIQDETKTFPESLLEGFFNSENKCVIMNADGYSKLPFPVKKKKMVVSGVFSDMVNDCWDAKTGRLKALPGAQSSSASGVETKNLTQVLKDVSEMFAQDTPPSTSYYKYANSDKQEQNSNETFKVQNVVPDNEKGVDSSRMNSNSSNVHQEGNAVYDDKGDFLFKIP